MTTRQVDSAAGGYDFRAIERRWQTRWRAERAFEAERIPSGPTFFPLVFPPYPNGRIHMGHVRNYTIGDVLARYKRMCGHAVLHPIGFDAFGLPNEMEAARHDLDPAVVTVRNIREMRRQLKALGYSYDWRAMLITINPRYYRWNQWLFANLFERDLAYRKEARIQWCPGCRTSLANEQVLDGRCWRCEQVVLTRYQHQWFFRFRAYVDEMWRETEDGSFPPNIAAMLKEWIRRMPGAKLRFPVIGHGASEIATFTTKPELSWGARYLALSSEHPLAPVLVRGTAAEPDLERLRQLVRTTEKPGDLLDGFDSGAKARHPLTGEAIPIWVAAHVDAEFGTGAIMGNPCHDRQDHAFGRRHGLPGKAVSGPSWDHAACGPYLDDGVLRDSGPFSGRLASEARDDVIRDWEARRIGARTTAFGLRDWLVSRQRAWGVPIPIVHCPSCGTVAVPVHDLPVRLPKNLRHSGGGNPLLARPDFLGCRCPRCAGPGERETDTMDTFLDTAWYYLRSTSPREPDALCDRAAAARWGPADLYIGGIEIAVPIMLYGSFVTKALRDAGLVDFSLPCRAVLAHEMVLKDGRKMSKSLGNTVDPMTLIEQVGADAVRFVVLALAPPLKKIEWSEERLQGCHRFLSRVWALGCRQAALPRTDPFDGGAPSEAEAALVGQMHETIRAVTVDLERLQPNTCLTALIKFCYALEDLEKRPCGNGVMAERPAFRQSFQTLLVLLAPFTPHLCEELWERLGLTPSVGRVPWPSWDAAAVSPPTRQIAVKVNGRTVVRLDVTPDASKSDVLALAYAHEAVQASLGAPRAAREIYVENRMLSLVT